MNGAADGGHVARVLVVEDEILICLLIETILTDAHYEVLIANSISEALGAIDDALPDVAILDLNLKGEKVFPVAEKLAAASVPFIFATGGGGLDIAEFPGRPWIAKPFRESELLDAVNLLAHCPTSAASG